MLGNLSKFYGAIAGAILAQVLLKKTGIDVYALGVGAEFGGLVAAATEVVVTTVGGLIAGLVTYLFPANKPKRVDDFNGGNV